MKATKIDVQITKNLGNYESVRIGGEWSLADGETIEQATAEAVAQLEETFRLTYFDPNGGRKKLARIGTPEMDGLLRRIEKGGVTWEMITAWYMIANAEAYNALRLALDTNSGNA